MKNDNIEKLFLKLEKEAEQLSAAEAIFGFCSWLTTRKEITSIGTDIDVAPIIKLIEQFMNANQLKIPRRHWEKILLFPEE